MTHRLFPLIACSLPLFLQANAFQENMERLNVKNPEFLFHTNVEDDYNILGTFLSEAYLAYLQTSSDLPPIPVNFQSFFHRLGLGTLTSVTLSSEPVRGRGFLNQSLFRFDGPPTGYFLLTGDKNEPFTIGQLAPSNAHLAAEFKLDGVALVDIIRNLAADLMGDLGRGLIDAQLVQPLTEDGLTLQDVINRLRTRVHLAAQANFEADSEAPPAMAIFRGNFAIRIAGLADLLPSLAPLLQQAGLLQGQGPSQTAWMYTVNGAPFPLSIFFEPVEGSKDLLVYMNEGSRDWFLRADTALSSSDSFQAAITGLPKQGVSFWYADKYLSEMQIQNLDSQMPPESQYRALAACAKTFLMRFTGAQAGVGFLEEDAFRVMSYQPTSYKTSVAVAALAFPVSMLAALPPPQAEEEPAQEEEEETSPAY